MSGSFVGGLCGLKQDVRNSYNPWESLFQNMEIPTRVRLRPAQETQLESSS